MSIFRKGSKHELEELAREAARKDELEQEANNLMKKSLEAVDDGLRVKREVRERAARFIGSLRTAHPTKG